MSDAQMEEYSSDENYERANSPAELSQMRALIRQNTPRQPMLSDAHSDTVEYTLELDYQRRLASLCGVLDREPLVTETRLLRAAIELITGKRNQDADVEEQFDQLVSHNQDMTASMTSSMINASKPWDISALTLARDICKAREVAQQNIDELESVIREKQDDVDTSLAEGDLTLWAMKTYQDHLLKADQPAAASTGDQVQDFVKSIEWFSANGKSVRDEWYRLVESDLPNFQNAGRTIEATVAFLVGSLSSVQNEENNTKLQVVVHDAKGVLAKMDTLRKRYKASYHVSDDAAISDRDKVKDFRRFLSRLYLTEEEGSWLKEWGRSIVDRDLLVKTATTSGGDFTQNSTKVRALHARVRQYHKYLRTIEDGSSDTPLPKSEETNLATEIAETREALLLLSQAKSAMSGR